MKVTFNEIKEGERFTTHYSKRLMTCLKIAPTDGGGIRKRNAVILLDHVESPADDLGVLVVFDDSEEVEVIR